MATKKNTGSRSRQGQAKAKAKVGKVMHEFKHGQLKSGGRGRVKSRKQAIAIGLSEARRAGASIPGKKSGAKKKAAKTSARKKAPAAKKKAPARRKSAARKGAKKR